MSYLFKRQSMLLINVMLFFINSPIQASDTVITFDDTPKPSAPDYSLKASWAASPSVPRKSHIVPLGSTKAVHTSQVDVFYIHPTTLKNKAVWNQDLSDSKTNDWTDVSVIARQASVFNHCCEIYAPRYRQASFRTGDPELKGDNGKAYQLAYSDVLRAFNYYLEHNNHGRPFILAGHSQGALMAYWLLRDKIDRQPLQAQLVTAYLIGIDLMQGDFGRTYHALRLCTKPEQTGCILSWNAGTKALNIDMAKNYAGLRYAFEYNTQEGRKSVCINPLTFDIERTRAPAALSKGAVPGFPGKGPLLALKAGMVAAYCDRGFLIVDIDPSLDLTPLPGGSMHYHEFGLFYADIKDNIALRIEHFLKR